MITQWDFSVLNWIAEHIQHPLLDNVMIFFTTLGELGWIWIVLGSAAVLPEIPPAGAAILLSLLLSLIFCNSILKLLVARPRPFIQQAVQLIIDAPGEFSFPSGHASASFAAATALFCLHRKIGTAALILAGLISFSRLYLYVHFPTDVLAGALTGCILGVIAACWLSKYLLRFSFFRLSSQSNPQRKKE